jgi:hypothetical protein
MEKLPCSRLLSTLYFCTGRASTYNKARDETLRVKDAASCVSTEARWATGGGTDSAGSFQSDNPSLQGHRRSLSTVIDVQLFQDMADMKLDRDFGDVEG